MRIDDLISGFLETINEATKEDSPDLEDTKDNNDTTDQEANKNDSTEEDSTDTTEEPPLDDTTTDTTTDTTSDSDTEPPPESDAVTNDIPNVESNKISSGMSDPQKKLFILQKFEELNRGYTSLESLVNSIIVSNSLNNDGMKLLRKLLSKIQFNQTYLRDILEENYVDSVDVNSLKKLFNLYFEDLKTCTETIKILNRLKNEIKNK
jgi:hypothetical protein